MNDHELARRLAEAAGTRLLAVREEFAGASTRDRKDAGDRRAQEFLAAELARYRPADAILSEEAEDDTGRLDAERVWIVDPLDGTREFAEPGRADWAVHVALWERGELTAGAVALPAQDVTFATPDVSLATNGGAGPAPRLIVSRSRPPAVAEEVGRRLGGQLVPLGSAGAKAMALIQGRADIYLHAGGQYEWDSAAPVAVARAAGLHASRIDGSPLTYNRPDPLLPDLLICHPRYAEAVLAITTSF
ncbi:3'(2'),5'-bisphosphate nucleotidase CysQ [Pseudonocardia eucalypti]|uniref:3'(2'),5'-bisphosphate nucleotidase CysQ n=1 Tax=Pseudonocardia eucalypti TaxID=648755 RepID=A0ABP9QM24_9PSEU|nr:3'(2'), 5'-bisphosphate nucleotidase [Pseudonocardia eucalypti]